MLDRLLKAYAGVYIPKKHLDCSCGGKDDEVVAVGLKGDVVCMIDFSLD